MYINWQRLPGKCFWLQKQATQKQCLKSWNLHIIQKSPLLSYSNEIELTAVVNLVYLAARDSYFMEREDKAGIGYVVFISIRSTEKRIDIILELKVDYTAKEAIQQIKDRKYALKFQGRLGEGRTLYRPDPCCRYWL